MVWNEELKREIPTLWEVRQVTGINDIAGFFSGLFRQPTAEEFLYLRTYLVHVLLDEVGADVGGTRDEEQFLVSGACGLGKGFLRHVATVGNLAGDNKQGLRDEVCMVGGIPSYHVHQRTLQIGARGVGTLVRYAIIKVAVAVEVNLNLPGIVGSRVRKSHHLGLGSSSLFLSGQRCLALTLDFRIHLGAHIAVAAHIASIEQAQRTHGLDALVHLCRSECVTATAADAESSDAVWVNAWIVL